MRLKCNVCGKVVSTEVPNNTVVRAWLECPECIELEELGNQNSREHAKRIAFESWTEAMQTRREGR